jgi:hypothetical protein
VQLEVRPIANGNAPEERGERREERGERREERGERKEERGERREERSGMRRWWTRRGGQRGGVMCRGNSNAASNSNGSCVAATRIPAL